MISYVSTLEGYALFQSYKYDTTLVSDINIHNPSTLGLVLSHVILQALYGHSYKLHLLAHDCSFPISLLL